MWYITLNEFLFVDPSLHLRDKSHLIMVYDPFSAVEFSLLVFCWEFLHLYSLGILVYSFLFLCCPYLALVSEEFCPHKMSFEVFPPLQYFERVWEGLTLNILYTLGGIHRGNYLVLEMDLSGLACVSSLSGLFFPASPWVTSSSSDCFVMLLQLSVQSISPSALSYF